MGKRKYIFFFLKRGILYFVILLFMFLLALCSNQTLPAAKNALLLCGETIIPSLFPFFVLSYILVNTNFPKICGKVFSPLMHFLFNVSGEGAVAFVVGIISGYPSGAKTVCSLYKSGDISKKDAKRLLPFCNNSGPLFIIGAVGVGMLFSREMGLFLYSVHLLSAILTGIFMRFVYIEDEVIFEKIPYKKENKPLGMLFSESVKESVNSTLLVCGFIVLFSAVSAPFLSLIRGNGITSSLFKGILEVTIGTNSLSQIPLLKEKLCLISGIIGFGGICVLLQVAGIVKEAGLGVKTYFFGKVFQGITATFLCNVMFDRFNAVAVFAQNKLINFDTGNFGATVTAIFIICVFYLVVFSIRKNSKKC